MWGLGFNLGILGLREGTLRELPGAISATRSSSGALDTCYMLYMYPQRSLESPKTAQGPILGAILSNLDLNEKEAIHAPA